MTELTRDEVDLLNMIFNDKYSVGGFCGMIFNRISEFEKPFDTITDEEITKVIKLALRIRLLANKLGK
jgi:hypothetical protein